MLDEPELDEPEPELDDDEPEDEPEPEDEDEDELDDFESEPFEPEDAVAGAEDADLRESLR